MEREDSVEEMLLGLVSQIAEADDMQVVEDLQSKLFKCLVLEELGHCATMFKHNHSRSHLQ